MKKLVFTVMLILLLTSTAFGVVYLGTTYLWKSDQIRQTLWTDNDATIINTATATQAYAVQPLCTKGSVLFDNLTGTGIRNVTVDTTYMWTDEEGVRPDIPTTFFNTIGSTSTPYHQIDPGDTDTHKFDFNSRWFNYWRLTCVAGCDLTNTIGTAVGFCGKDVE